MADLSALKGIRRTAKAKVTKTCNKVGRVVAEDGDLSSISQIVDQLKDSFRDFTVAHDNVVDKDDDEVEFDHQKYYLEVEANYIDTLCKVKPHLVVGASSSGTSHVNDDLVKLLSLPKVTLEIFSGDPLKYYSFIRAFDVNVDRLCTDPDSKIARLLQYTGGEAHEAIIGVQITGGLEGYTRARDTLKELYGSKHLITESILKNLRKAKLVKSQQDMRQLCNELRNARDVLTDLGLLGEVNAQVVIFGVVTRLPNFVQHRWSKKELKSKRDSDTYLKFPDLVEFVKLIADEMSDPLCGTEAMSDRCKEKKQVSVNATQAQPQANNRRQRRRNSGPSNVQCTSAPSTGGALAGSDSDSPRAGNGSGTRRDRISSAPCKLCAQPHYITRCPDFKCLTVQDRIDFVQNNNLCGNCLRGNHTTLSCTSKSRCFVCQQKHSAFLHTDVSLTSNAVSTGNCFMPTVKVLINDRVWVKAALDTFSSNSFCTKSIAKSLDLKGPVTQYTLNTMGGTSPAKSKQVSMKLSAGNELMHISGVKVVEKIPVSSASLDQSMFPHLRDIDLSANIDCHEVDLLLGQDFAEALFPLQTRKGNPGEPYAVKYKFGWGLNGKAPVQNVNNHVVVCNYISATPTFDTDINASSEASVFPNVNRLWDLENEGIDEPGLSVSDKRVIAFWDANCKKDGTQYELPIPWKNREEKLPNNFLVARRRLDNLTKRLHRENLYDRYDREIEKLLEENYAEVVPASAMTDATRVWYLPHHCVQNPNKPDKLRVVYDCASKFEGQSLNDRCQQGPDLINKLLFVLLRFRLHGYAVQADIISMYNRIRIPDFDRDALRFLWYKDGMLVHLRMSTHLFGGVWCASSSAYALRRTVLDNPMVDPLVRDTILEAMYVDDLAQSVRTRQEVHKIVVGVPAVLQTGGFELTKFSINDEELLKEIPTIQRAKEVVDFTPDSVGKTLGIKWNVHEDIFFFSVQNLPPVRVSRRSMLAFVSTIYDPLQIIIPWILPGKLLFQEATKLKLSWDDEVSVNMRDKWSAWVQSLDVIRGLKFPRCVKPFTFDGSYYEYHVFADAGEDAYGACAYLRCVNIKGEITCQLLMSKGHVAPIKHCTIPRLELQAAVKAAKILSVLRSELHLQMVPAFLWSDSKIVLGYITNEDRRFRTFVENRVTTIRDLTDVHSWNWIASGENPADLLTKSKGLTASNQSSELWKHGPIWLRQHASTWPCTGSKLFQVTNDDPEIRLVSTAATAVTGKCWLQDVCERFSSWTKMLRSIAWIRRWVLSMTGHTQSRGPLLAPELNASCIVLIKHIQEQAYKQEIVDLFAGRSLSRSSSLLSLSPYLDEHGLLRVGGRTGDHPILLPSSHVAVAALVRNYHACGHVGCEWTLGLIRRKYWIVKARPLIRRILRKCIHCRKLYAGVCSQYMSDLPVERLEPGLPAFSYVGIDAFGPFQSKTNRTLRKRYGVIFTCFTTRAIHIEMLNSLDAESFTNAFRRFIARRGLPLKAFSDRGGNFIRSEKQLREAFLRHTQTTLQAYAASRFIEWSFNPPLSPHKGGVWERMIGTIKRVFRAILGKATTLTDEILSTIFCEVESIVNSRPLTKMSDDPKDLTPLTPNSILILRQGAYLPPKVGCASDAYRSRWRYVQHLATEFWQRWVREYLPQLQRRSKWTEESRNLKVGELVMVVEASLPRNLWPLAIVKEIYPGRDGRVRSVLVKTRVTELHRSITQLVRLELD